MLKALFALTYHEIQMTLRQGFSWVTPLIFFVIVVSLFPFALGSDQTLLNKAAPGIIWIAALLSILLSIGHLFRHDAEEGYLDILLLSPHPLTLLVFSKVVSHWLTQCLPLIIISPLLGCLLHFSMMQQKILVITLLLGTPVLSLLGAIGAALIVGIRSHGLLLPILIMPLYIPILIFGTSTLLAVTIGQSAAGYFAVMGALLLLSLAFAPLLTAVALRIGVNQ